MKTVKSRKRKFALSMKIAAMLSCIAIASVGFASWLIVIKPEDQSQSGNITASTVSEKGLELSSSWVGSKNSIILGKPSEVANNGWLLAQDSIDEEVLSATLNVTYKPINITTAKITVDFLGHIGAKPESAAWNEDTARLVAIKDYIDVTVTVSGDGVTSPVSQTYNNGLEPIVINLTGLNTEGTNNATKTLTVLVQFSWKFGEKADPYTPGVNPYTYYNGLDNNATNRAAAKTALEAIYDAVHGTDGATTDDLYFEVTVTGEADPS